MPEKSKPCPLCGTPLPLSRYYQIIGVWEARSKLEESLKTKLADLEQQRRQLLAEKRTVNAKMKAAVKDALRKGRQKEKSRADKLAEMIQGKASTIRNLNAKIKELQEQLKSGSTPQDEGRNYEKDLVVELQKTFPNDEIEHHGQAGDILHKILLKNRVVASILYECKKTDIFQNSFINQTKKAMAKRKARYGVLVTFASKKGTTGFWTQDGIMVVHPYGAVHLAKVLRNSLIELHSIRATPAEIDKRATRLWDYIKSDAFKSVIDDSIYRTRAVYDMLLKEMKAHKTIWKNRWMHYNAINENLNSARSSTTNILRGQEPGDGEVKQLPPPAIR
jgi:hypothetical protein